MPNRIIRDGILRSKAVAQLHPMAELFYRRLMSVCDDFGRYYADPALLLSDCFPIRPSWADEEGVVKWLEQCKSFGLLKVYEANGSIFLQIEKFGQRTKPGQKSKFPELPGVAGIFPEGPASRARSSSPPTPPPTPTSEDFIKKSGSEKSSPDDGNYQFEELLGMFIALGRGLTIADRVTCENLWFALDPPAQMQALSFARESLGEWQTRPTEKIAQPWNYLRERHWDRAAPRLLERTKPATRADEVQERAANKFREATS